MHVYLLILKNFVEYENLFFSDLSQCCCRQQVFSLVLTACLQLESARVLLNHIEDDINSAEKVRDDRNSDYLYGIDGKYRKGKHRKGKCRKKKEKNSIYRTFLFLLSIFSFSTFFFSIFSTIPCVGMCSVSISVFSLTLHIPNSVHVI
jgi:hypothetical protein